MHNNPYIIPVFLALFLAGQIIGWRLWLRLLPEKAHRPVHLIFISFNLAWLVTLVTLYQGDSDPGRFWPWVGRPALAWQFVYIIGILPLGVLASGLVSLARLRRPRKPAVSLPVSQKRRDFLKIGGAGGSLAILGLSGYGLVRQSRPPGVVRQSLLVAGLPAELDGFKIGQISDIHLGLWSSQEELARSLEVLAATEPDLVALTGDLVDRNAEFARLYREPLKILQKVPHGVWGVLGNHDHYTGRPERVAEILDGHGLNMLMDRRVNLPGRPLTLIGLNDQGAHLNWVGRALNAKRRDDYVLNFETLTGPGARPDDWVILLNHRPEGLSQAVEQGVSLYLAGHTHGGQYQLPYFDQANAAAFFYKYTSGLYQEGPAWINVSRGVASVGIPFRLWAWPEVNLITLKASSRAR